MNDAPGRPISAADEIRRVDEISNTLFEVYIAIAVGAAAVVFAVDNNLIRIITFVFGTVAGAMALGVIPDVVFAQGEPDRSDDSIQRYLKSRQRNTQIVILVLFALVELALIIGLAFLISGRDVGSLVGGLVGGLVFLIVVAWRQRDWFWPPQIREER